MKFEENEIELSYFYGISFLIILFKFKLTTC